MVFERVVKCFCESVFVAIFSHARFDSPASKSGDKFFFDVLFTAVRVEVKAVEIIFFSFFECLPEDLLRGDRGVHCAGETQPQKPAAVQVYKACGVS